MHEAKEDELLADYGTPIFAVMGARRGGEPKIIVICSANYR